MSICRRSFLGVIDGRGLSVWAALLATASCSCIPFPVGEHRHRARCNLYKSDLTFLNHSCNLFLGVIDGRRLARGRRYWSQHLVYPITSAATVSALIYTSQTCAHHPSFPPSLPPSLPPFLPPLGCRQCNRRKGKRTVKELKDIGMVLMNPPRKPKMSELQRQARLYRTAAGTFPHESWQTYLGGPPENPEEFM
jgi:hypothetical protein